MDFDARATVSQDYPAVVLLGRCKGCRRGHRVEAQPGRAGGRAAFRIGEVVALAVAGQHASGAFVGCGCGARVNVSKLRAKCNPAKACTPACLNATRAVCECACGGENHGASW